MDRIFFYGCKCEGTVANGHLRLQIKGYGCGDLLPQKLSIIGWIELEYMAMVGLLLKQKSKHD